jgi:adenylate kinase
VIKIKVDNKILIWVGGPKGVGKTTITKNALNDVGPIINTGKLSRLISEKLKNNVNFNNLSRKERFELINLDVVSKLNKIFQNKNIIILDSHFYSGGIPTWSEKTLKELCKIKNLNFLLVHVNSNEPIILDRINEDIKNNKKDRSQYLQKIHDDIMKSENCWNENIKILRNNKKDVTGIQIFNQDSNHAAKILRQKVKMFISNKKM